MSYAPEGPLTKDVQERHDRTASIAKMTGSQPERFLLHAASDTAEEMAWTILCNHAYKVERVAWRIVSLHRIADELGVTL